MSPSLMRRSVGGLAVAALLVASPPGSAPGTASPGTATAMQDTTAGAPGDTIAVDTVVVVAADTTATPPVDSAIADLSFLPDAVIEEPQAPASESLPVSIGLFVLTTVVLFLLWKGLAALEPRVAGALGRFVSKRARTVHVRGVELFAAEQLEAGFRWMVRAGRYVLSLALLVGYLPLVFWFFPRTRNVTLWFLQMVAGPFERAGLAIVGYLPNLLNIAVILFLTKKGIDLMGVLFRAVERGSIRIRGFYADWARPTNQLLRVLVIAFALVVVWPYLPGSSSPAFQGIAAFVGLLVTFGSAGAVSNAVGGVVMVYMRPFQVGDRVKIADTFGEVVERGILVTRIRTPKRVVITVPNAQVIGNHIVNYSRIAKNTGLLLHTTVTIGYDVPWPEVHEAMKAAAMGIDGILDDPAPFVLQTALGDYAVSYELNASTDQPDRMAELYSDLHTRLQDQFARAGIEITSPVYHAVRDGNPTTVPPAEAVSADSVPEEVVPSEAELDESDLDYAGVDSPEKEGAVDEARDGAPEPVEPPESPDSDEGDPEADERDEDEPTP